MGLRHTRARASVMGVVAVIAALGVAACGGGGARRPAGPPFPTDALLTEFDTDGDGAIARAELNARRQTSFSLSDLNADGFVTQAEVNQAQANFSEIRPEGGRLFRSLTPPPVDPGAMDANRDGAVSLREYLSTPLQILVQFDTDRDGRVTRRELEDAGKRRAAQAAGDRGER